MRDLRDYKVLNPQVESHQRICQGKRGIRILVAVHIPSIALGTDTPRKLYDDASAAYCALLAETWNPSQRCGYTGECHSLAEVW